MQDHDIGVYIQRARQALSERRFDDARSIYRTILEVDPAQPRAWLALSALAQNDGDFREAVGSVRSAAKAWRKSDSQALITELCMRLLVLGEYEEARGIIAGADWTDPSVLRHSMGLVQYLGLVEAHEEALRFADLALARTRSSSAALVYARANALRHLGHMQEAEHAYELCLALDPLHAEAHWALAHHQKSHSPGERVSRIRKALSHTKLDSEDAVYLQFALFKELDAAGSPADAWKALDAGVRSKRNRVRFDDATDEATFQALRQICNEEFLTASAPTRANDGNDAAIPVFIVGLPRSGTTLLERMLSNHPDVVTAGELNDFPFQLSWALNRFIGETPRADVVEACRELDYAQLGRGYVDRTAWRAKGARFLVDKLPNNILHAGFVHKALPQAKIICVRRSAMDSCFSTFKHLFSGSAYAFSYGQREMAGRYRRFEQLVDHWEDVASQAFLGIRYEELVAAPESVLARVSSFCGLSYRPEMVDIQANSAPSATASSSQIREPVHTRNVNGWTAYARWLTEMEAALEPRQDH